MRVDYTLYPKFYDWFFSDLELQEHILTGKEICVEIIEYDTINNFFVCKIDQKNMGYIYLHDYLPYSIIDPNSEIGKFVYATVKSYSNEYKKYKLNRIALILRQINSLEKDQEVFAKVISIYNDITAFCEFGYGIRANISVTDLLPHKIVNSIADVVYPGFEFDAKIKRNYKRNYYSLTTRGVERNYVNPEIESLVLGRPYLRVNNNVKDEYSYSFLISLRTVGIIRSKQPLGYNREIYAQVKTNDNKLNLIPIII